MRLGAEWNGANVENKQFFTVPEDKTSWILCVKAVQLCIKSII